MERKKVLFASKNQFGYNTPMFKKAQYASGSYQVTFVCWHYGMPEIRQKNINIIYVSRKGNKITRTIRLIKTIKKHYRNGFDIIYANYFWGISLLKLSLGRTYFPIYINTLYVADDNTIKGLVNNALIKFEIFFFRHIATVSTGVANKLRLKNYHIIPMGGESFKTTFENKDSLSLIYVGTLGNRNIIQCVKGFHQFIEAYPERKFDQFVIIGNSDGDELDEIATYVKRNNLGDRILTKGFVPQHELEPFYNDANLGVSYVPITPYYDNQPPLKTTEYLVSGLPVIATKTISNQKMVTSKDGVLIHDTEEDFFKGLITFVQKQSTFNSLEIKERNQKHHWLQVVEKKFYPLIENELVNKD